MPTENELKYVLDLACEQDIAKRALQKLQLRQAYLSNAVRIRKVIEQTSDCYRLQHWLTFKKEVSGRVIEIEKRISPRDFRDLWSVSENKLRKSRYNLNQGEWEIDAFHDEQGKTYIVVAEHEMIEGQMEPETIPGYISNNLVYAVPKTDDRFFSKKLADIEYAKKLYSELKEK